MTKWLKLKNNKIFFWFLVILFIVGLFLLINKMFFENGNYQTRISINIPERNAKFIDEFYSKNISDELTQIKEIKEVLCISGNEILNVYLKFSPILINKTKIIQKTDEKIENIVSKMSYAHKNLNENAVLIDFDDEYGLNYDTFILLNYNKNVNISKIKKYTNDIISELLKLGFSNQIKTFNNQKKAVYLYFNYSTLRNLKLTLNDIKEKIKDYNLDANFASDFNEQDEYRLEIKNKINSVEDIKNIKLNFQNVSYAQNFENIFDIKEEIKTPILYKIKNDNFESVLFAISKKKFYPNIVYNLKLKKFIKNYNSTTPDYLFLDEFKTNRFKKITLYFSPYSSNEKLESIQKDIEEKLKEKKISNTLFFLGIDNPKISKNDLLVELDNNKIIILCQKSNYNEIKKILKENNYRDILAKKRPKYFINSDFMELKEEIEEAKEEQNGAIDLTKSKNEIIYEFEPDTILKYDLKRLELTQAILAQKTGLKLGEFFSDNEKTDIILKSNNDFNDAFIYSKKYNSLISIDTLTRQKLKNQYYSIARRNGDYIAKLSYFE